MCIEMSPMANVMCMSIGPWELYELFGYTFAASLLLLLAVSLFPRLADPEAPLVFWRTEK